MRRRYFPRCKLSIVKICLIQQEHTCCCSRIRCRRSNKSSNSLSNIEVHGNLCAYRVSFQGLILRLFEVFRFFNRLFFYRGLFRHILLDRFRNRLFGDFFLYDDIVIGKGHRRHEGHDHRQHENDCQQFPKIHLSFAPFMCFLKICFARIPTC